MKCEYHIRFTSLIPFFLFQNEGWQHKVASFGRCFIGLAQREIIYGVLLLLEMYSYGGWAAANVYITLS